MSHALGALGLVALISSCAFDLDTVPPPGEMHDANVVDSSTSDGSASDGVSDAPCAMQVFSVPAEADTIIASSSSGLNFGAGPVANVGTGIGSVGLFRFDVTMLPATAHIQSASVTLTYAAKSNQCAMGCGSCSGIEHAGTLSLFAMRSDWVELQATWTNAATGRLWASAGASQSGVDRSLAPLVSVSHVADNNERFQVDSAALSDLNSTWRQNDKISFELVPSSSAVMVVATRESPTEACVIGGYAAAKLTIAYCP